MKRERFLWPLTAGHKEALMAVQDIRDSAQSIRLDGAMGALAALTEGTKDFFRNRLEPHFRAEETLAGLLSRHPGPGQAAVEKVITDHRTLRALFRKNSLDSLLLFADGLETHIQYEETVFFPLLQETLVPDEKQEAAEMLEKNLTPSSKSVKKKEMNGGKVS